MTITEIRAISGLNKTKFAEKYNIPYRTLQDWEAGIRNPPSYVLDLLERVVRADFTQEITQGFDETAETLAQKLITRL